MKTNQYKSKYYKIKFNIFNFKFLDKEILQQNCFDNSANLLFRRRKLKNKHLVNV